MKKMTPYLLVLLVGFFLMAVTGCAQKTMPQAGFLKDYSQLGEDPMGFADLNYKKDNVVWGVYDKVIIDSVVFFLKDDAAYKGIDADDFNELAQHWNDSMVKSMGQSYKIVTEPGPNTLRLRLAITDLVPGSPAAGTVTTVVPVGLAASSLKKLATGTHIGMGEAAFEAEIQDAQTGEILAAAMKKSTGSKYKIGKSVTEWGQVEGIFDEWTDNLRQRLDRLSGR